MNKPYIFVQLERGIVRIELKTFESYRLDGFFCIHFADGSSLDFQTSRGQGIYTNKHRWHHEFTMEEALAVADSLTNWQPSDESKNPFAIGQPFDPMHLMIKQVSSGKKEKPTVVWREIFKIKHQQRHDMAMEQVFRWDNTQLTIGLFRTFLWHLLFEYNTDFETATPDQVKGFMDYVKRQVEAGIYQKSYANQAQRIVEFFANLPIHNKNGVLRRPASGIQNPHFTETDVAELSEAFRVTKRLDMPPKTPFFHHVLALEKQLIRQVSESEKLIAEAIEKGIQLSSVVFHKQRRDYRSMVIFLLVKEHGLFPRDIINLQLNGWVADTGELAISETETVKVSVALKRHLTRYLEMVDRDSEFLDHDQGHLLVRCLYYPSADTLNEWLEIGEAYNQESFAYRPIGNDIIERVFAIWQRNSEGQKERLQLTAKKVRNYFLKKRLVEGTHPVNTSYYSKKFLSETTEPVDD